MAQMDDNEDGDEKEAQNRDDLNANTSQEKDYTLSVKKGNDCKEFDGISIRYAKKFQNKCKRQYFAKVQTMGQSEKLQSPLLRLTGTLQGAGHNHRLVLLQVLHTEGLASPDAFNAHVDLVLLDVDLWDGMVVAHVVQLVGRVEVVLQSCNVDWCTQRAEQRQDHPHPMSLV